MSIIFRPIAAAALLLTFYFSAISQQVGKTIPNSISPDKLIGFLEFRPKDYGSQKHPLIIYLHGVGERGNGTTQINNVAANALPRLCSLGASMRFTVGGVTSSFVVLSPQLSTAYGSWPTYYVKEMIKYAKANLQIDPNRIYITGISLGGGGVWRAITEVTGGDYSFDGGIAAAAPCCGTQETIDGNFCATVGANHLPVWAFHSMDDRTVNVSATQHAERLSQGCGVTPASKFTYYLTGDHWKAWVNAFDTGHITTPVAGGGRFTANPNLYEWFLSNTRSTGNTPPLANAGSAQVITLPVSTVTLTGTGTGTNGATIASYSWAKTSGPAGESISTPLANTTLVTGLTQGVYVFTLTVKDNHGLTSSASVTITVNSVSYTAPIANAGSAQTITLPTSSVNLTGTGNGTNGATIASYSWVKTSGPSAASITAAAAANTAVTGLVQGVYVFTLTVKDNHGLTGSASVTITVNAAASGKPTGYIKQASSPYQACQDASTSGRITVYMKSVANGSVVYLDAAYRKVFNGGWNWFSFTPSLGGSVTQDFAVYPNGVVFQLSNCPGTPVTQPSSPPSSSNLLGYIKVAAGPNQACSNKSAAGRVAVYGKSISNGSYLYTDAAMTKVYNGGWNWFSFTAVAGGSVTNTFAVYPIGIIFLKRNCTAGSRTIDAAGTSSVEEDEAMLRHLRDSAEASITGFGNTGLVLYPNPVHANATIQFNSAENGFKTINLYNASGVLKAKYTWQTIKGNNIFSLKDVPGLANGLYIIDIRDSNGKPVGSLKFLKM